MIQVDSQATAAKAKPRYEFIDLARGFAIALALFSHVMLGAGGWGSIPDDALWLQGFRVLTRTATPTFILLFGVSLEIAYVRRWGTDPIYVRKRLLRRAILCYVALVALALASAVGAAVTFPEAFLGMVFLERVLNGNIFTFYVFAMLLGLLLIPLRRKVGLLATFAITLLWYPVAAIIRATATFSPVLDTFMSRVFGVGTEFGPSVMHAMALVAGGMIIANFVKNPHERRARLYAGIAIGVGVVAALAAAVKDGPVGAAAGFVAHYRATNEFGYYAIGGLLAIVVLVVCWLVTKKWRLGSKGPGAFGGNSLHAFALGNVIINLFIAHIAFDNFWLSLLFAVAFVVVFWIAFKAWLRIYLAPPLGGYRRFVNGK